MLCASCQYSRRMIDLKTFQIREESYTPGRCLSGQNERRDFITRIRIQNQNGRQLTQNCINPAIADGYIVVSICATIVEPDERLSNDSSYWALFVRQEEPDIYHKTDKKCTVKIRLDGTVLFCDTYFADILEKPHSDIRQILGQKIWEILVSPRDQNDLKNVISDVKTKKQEVSILTKTNKRIFLEARPIINPHS